MRLDDSGVRRLIAAGLLLAITLLLVFTRVGMIPVPTPAANATISRAGNGRPIHISPSCFSKLLFHHDSIIAHTPATIKSGYSAQLSACF